MKVYFKNSFVWLTHKKREKQGLLLPLATHGPVVNQPAVLCIVSLIIAATDDYVVIALQLLGSEVNILQTFNNDFGSTRLILNYETQQ